MMGVLCATYDLVNDLNSKFSGKTIVINGWADPVEVDRFELDTDFDLMVDQVLIITISGEVIEYFTLPRSV